MLAQFSLPRLDDLFDGDVRVRAAEITDGLAELFPEERAAVSGAVPQRRHEFAAGRVLARAILAEMGWANAPLLPAVDRTPCWPQGAVGCIAHADGLCVVALARSRDFLSVGIDVEPAEPLETELWDVVCTKSERDDLNARNRPERGPFATMLFVAKEAVYKCWYPLTRVPLEFHEVTVEMDSSAGRFVARVAPEAAAENSAPRVYSGRVVTRERWILASTQLRRTDSFGSSLGMGAS